MRCVIAGSRHFTDRAAVVAAIERCPWLHLVTEVVTGDADGVDGIAYQWAIDVGIPAQREEAEWDNLTAPGAVVRRNRKTGKLYNAKAGPDRNRKMARSSDALILVWDGVSSGSASMLREAQRAGLEIWPEVLSTLNGSESEGVNDDAAR